MIIYHKHLAQYTTIVSLGPIGLILEKHFMLKQNCSVYEYVLAIGMAMFTFYLWFLYIKEKSLCQNILIKELDNRYIVNISKSKWDDLIVKITTKNCLRKFIGKTVYNPQYTSGEDVKQIKWKNKLGIKFVIIDEEISTDVFNMGYSNFVFELNGKKFRFFYSI